MNNDTIPQAQSQPIYTREQARELTPEERLSPIDQDALDQICERAIEKANLLPQETEEDYLNYQMVVDAINEDCGMGSKQFLDTVRLLNDKFPDNPILIPSEADTIAGWLAKPAVQVQWDIEQLMAKGTTLIISGVTGIGKTWETDHLAFQFRLGGVWHGLQCRQLTSICVNLELTENQMQRRIRKLAGIYPTVRDITFLAHKGANYKLNTNEGKENLFGLLHSYGQNFGMVILDPLALFIKGKIDKVDWNNEVEPVLTDIKHEFGCSIILNHNFRKKVQIYGHSEDMFSPDRLKGLSDIIDRADNIVIFVSESQPRHDSQGTSQRIEIAKWIHAAKTREADRELKPHRVSWNYDQAMFEPEDELGWALPIDNR